MNSTLAGETQAALSATAEVEWAKIMVRDILKGDVASTDWQGKLGEFMSLQSEECQAFQKLSHQHIVDAKSLYDTLSKDVAGGRADRRTAIDLSILRDVFLARGARYVGYRTTSWL